MIRTDRLSGRRRDSHIEMMATHVGTHRLFFPLTPMTVCHITGERDLVPAIEITTTDVLRLLMEEEPIHPQARAATRNALHDITRKLKETNAAAAMRLTNAFRASVVNRNRPHATKMLTYFGAISRKSILRPLCVALVKYSHRSRADA